MLVLVAKIGTVQADGTIYIRFDGSIEPTSAPISTFDNITYVMTGDINDNSITVERDGIILDGNGYAIRGTGENGVILTDRNNTTLQSLRIEGFVYGILLNYSFKNTILYGNVTSIKLYASSNNTVSKTVLSHINLELSRYNIVSENHLKSVYMIGACWNNTFLRNEISYSSSYGVYISSCYNNTLSENNISHNNGYGIQMGSVLDVDLNNTICFNDISYNGYDGIDIDALGHPCASIFNNSISNNKWRGIYFFHSNGNMIFCNNFVGNLGVQNAGKHVFCYKSTNIWDNGATGNCWDDYFGSDSNGDGIGDSQYSIDANNRDNHPLMVPSAVPEFPSMVAFLLFVIASLSSIFIRRMRLRARVR